MEATWTLTNVEKALSSSGPYLDLSIIPISISRVASELSRFLVSTRQTNTLYATPPAPLEHFLSASTPRLLYSASRLPQSYLFTRNSRRYLNKPSSYTYIVRGTRDQNVWYTSRSRLHVEKLCILWQWVKNIPTGEFL